MSYQYNDPSYAPTYGEHRLAAAAEQSERMTFIRRTYAHLAGAIMAFVALEMLFFAITTVDLRMSILGQFVGNPLYFLLVLGAFIGVGMLAQYWASNATSRGMQYAGLGLYVLLETVIFLPILIYANDFPPIQAKAPFVIQQAGLLTAVVFIGLTVGVFVTKKDFSFLGGFLWVAGLLAMGLILCAYFFGFGLGMWFSAAMIGLACLYILFFTSQVMYRYRTDQYVAAALALFACVADLFYWILRLLLQNSQSN